MAISQVGLSFLSFNALYSVHIGNPTLQVGKLNLRDTMLSKFPEVTQHVGSHIGT